MILESRLLCGIAFVDCFCVVLSSGQDASSSSGQDATNSQCDGAESSDRCEADKSDASEGTRKPHGISGTERFASGKHGGKSFAEVYAEDKDLAEN